MPFDNVENFAQKLNLELEKNMALFRTKTAEMRFKPVELDLESYIKN